MKIIKRDNEPSQHIRVWQISPRFDAQKLFTTLGLTGKPTASIFDRVGIAFDHGALAGIASATSNVVFRRGVSKLGALLMLSGKVPSKHWNHEHFSSLEADRRHKELFAEAK